MPLKINRGWRIVLAVVAVLVALRAALPYVVKHYVNRVLSNLEGYRGSVRDIDLHLYRGAYQIDSLRIFKINGNEQIPFIDIPVTDLSVEWEALLKGSLVGEITFEKPVLNFIGVREDDDEPDETGESEEEIKQTGKEVDWAEPLKKLIPFDINRLRVNDGTVAFYDLSTEPKVDLFLHNLQLEALNLNNATDNPEALPARVYLQALSIGNGQLNLAMKINPLMKVPDLDADLQLESVDLRSLNDFFYAYANVDIENGMFNLYSEIAVSEGRITGYVKPLFTGLRVTDSGEEHDNAGQVVWESLVSFLTEIFENQKKDQFATRVPVEGEISEVNTGYWPALWGVFSNAFVEAFEHNTDRTVTLAKANVARVEEPAEEKNKTKKELRKERRKEKREERRKERKAKKEREENEKADKKSPKDSGK